jgi:hypothetical protein
VNLPPPATFAAADFDEDTDVDGDDLADWETGFGITGTAEHGDGDADEDADVDGHDFLVWQRQNGSDQAVVAGAPVPEPGAAALAAGALGGLLAMRRRGRRWIFLARRDGARQN